MRNAGSYDSLERILSEVPAEEREALREAWEMAGDAAPVSSTVRQLSWTAVSRQIAPRPVRIRLLPRPAQRVFRIPAVRQYAAVAASLILFVAAGYLSRPTESIYLAGSQPQVVQLSDGTEVDLAAGSEMRVSESFGTGNRSVELVGEAYFDVTPAPENDGLSFRVETFNSTVEVLGTAFNVRARRGPFEEVTSVAVAHGVVRVEAESQAVELAAGEGTRVEADTAPVLPAPVSLERATAWRAGGLAFDGVALGAVFEEIERRFELRVEAPEAITRIRVSYWRETTIGVDQILADLADVVGAEIRATANGFEVYQPEK